MKSLTIIIFLIINISFTYAQTVFNYTDSMHSFIISTDSIMLGDNVNYECYIKSISIYTKGKNKLLQIITPPENSFSCSMPQNQIFLLDDINFDGLTDFMIVQFIPAAPNIPYYYWTLNKQTQNFQRDTTLEEITSPYFDQKQKLITSFWRANCCDHGISTYAYINGKITLIEVNEIADDFDNQGQQIITKKKLINGEMKLIERKVEKVVDEK
jgi:hypothetical protein